VNNFILILLNLLSSQHTCACSAAFESGK